MLLRLPSDMDWTRSRTGAGLIRQETEGADDHI